MKKAKRLPFSFIAITLAGIMLAVAIGTYFGKEFESKAVFDPSTAITYQTFSGKTTVEDSVLFIGTYIIHKDALNDQLYEKASTSASDSGQNDIYYKSELSDGKWFLTGDIDNGVRGISFEGTPVANDTINPLYVTYYVGSDGIMKDAKTMAGVNPFDVPDPYNLSSLAELEPIRNQYTKSSSATSISQEDFLKTRNSVNQQTVRSDVYYYQLLSTFFSLNLRDAETDKCDEQLKQLNDAYISLKASGNEDEAQLVYELMESVDAKRRALIFERLNENEENLLNTLYTLSTGSYYTPYGDFKDSSSESNSSNQPDYTVKLEDSLKHKGNNQALPSWIQGWFNTLGITQSGDGWWTILEKTEKDRKERVKKANEDNEDFVQDQSDAENPFNADKDLLDSIGEAQSNCGESYTKYMGKALTDSEDVLGHAIYDYSTQVIEQTSGAGVGGPVTYLKHARNIRDSIINDKQGELDLLNSSLLSLAGGKYASSATGGAGSEYSQAVSAGAKSSALESQYESTESDRSMLQFLIEARRQRDTPPNALEYVNERISITEEMLKSIPGDDFKQKANNSVNAHLAWLRQEAQKIIDSDESLRSKLDELLDKKKELQKKRDSCLDNNDLAGAKAYDAKIAAVDQDIAAEGGDRDKMADALVDKALSKLADNADADLSGLASALAGIGATDQLNALADKAAESGASSNTMAGISDAQDEAKGDADKTADAKKDLENAVDDAGKNAGDGSGAGAGAGAGDGSGSGSGSGNGSGNGYMDANDLLAQLEALFGKSLDEMDERELAIADATVSRLSRSGIAPAEILTKQFTQKLVTMKNKYVYSQYPENKSTEYIDMNTLSKVTNYRYFYDDTKSEGTMTSGSKIYIFRRGSDEMHKQSMLTDGEDLTTKTVYSGNLYIAEDDSDSYFKCTSEYAYDTDYAVCLTPTMESKVQDYTESLSEFFKQ